MKKSPENQQHEKEENRRPKGCYANYFEVGHNAIEFVLDFGQLYSNEQGERFHTRVITVPTYAKAFCKTLSDAIQQYEETYGAVKEK